MGQEDGTIAGDYDREVLAHFSEAVSRHFAEVIARFQLVTTEAHIHRPDVWLKLQNNTTQLTIDYEWGVGCWVTIGRLSRWFRRITEEYSLEDVVRAAEPTAIFPDLTCPEYDRRCVDESIERLARMTLAHGAAVLAGDFSLLREQRQ